MHTRIMNLSLQADVENSGNSGGFWIYFLSENFGADSSQNFEPRDASFRTGLNLINNVNLN